MIEVLIDKIGEKGGDGQSLLIMWGEICIQRGKITGKEDGREEKGKNVRRSFVLADSSSFAMCSLSVRKRVCGPHPHWLLHSEQLNKLGNLWKDIKKFSKEELFTCSGDKGPSIAGSSPSPPNPSSSTIGCASSAASSSAASSAAASSCSGCAGRNRKFTICGRRSRTAFALTFTALMTIS